MSRCALVHVERICWTGSGRSAHVGKNSRRGVLERRRIVCIKRCTIKAKSRADKIELRIAHTVVRDQLPNFFSRIHFVFLTVVFR